MPGEVRAEIPPGVRGRTPRRSRHAAQEIARASSAAHAAAMWTVEVVERGRVRDRHEWLNPGSAAFSRSSERLCGAPEWPVAATTAATRSYSSSTSGATRTSTRRRPASANGTYGTSGARTRSCSTGSASCASRDDRRVTKLIISAREPGRSGSILDDAEREQQRHAAAHVARSQVSTSSMSLWANGASSASPAIDPDARARPAPRSGPGRRHAEAPLDREPGGVDTGKWSAAQAGVGGADLGDDVPAGEPGCAGALFQSVDGGSTASLQLGRQSVSVARSGETVMASPSTVWWRFVLCKPRPTNRV